LRLKVPAAVTLQAAYYRGPRENLQALLFFAERGLNIGKGDSKRTGCPEGGI